MRMMNFANRNFKEMLRDPILCFMCAGFPLIMLIMFAVINHFTNNTMSVFQLTSLIPGLMVFSFCFTMLMMCLLVSKDRSSAFLIRLYSSPMKSHDFVGGYVATGAIIGLLQEVVCIVGGWVLSLIISEDYFSFGRAVLLAIIMLPMLFMNVFAGILLGTAANDKAAPGISSIFISASGILGGAWMPLDTMGGFEKFCRFLPFYPATYLGRIVTGANHSVTNYMTMAAEAYKFDDIAKWSVPTILIYLVLIIVLCLIAFQRKKKI